MSKKWRLFLVIAIVVALVVVVGIIALKETKAPIVGNDKDVHGCIGSAGYSWCASSNKCYRPWEESCQSAGTFVEEGNLTKPSANGPWVLVFEKPGKPALTVGLIFDKDSVCYSGEITQNCSKDLKTGDRVQVQGKIQGSSGNEVLVSKIIILK